MRHTSMNTFIRRLLVLFVLLTSLKLHAQVDTTQGWRLVHGTLLEASPEQIRVEVAGANGVVGAETFAIGTETTVDGCELSRVQAGTQLLIYLSDMNSATPTAGYVKFYGCEPNWNILATILAISPGLLTLETRDNSVGNAGDTLDIVTNAETMFMSCTGMSRNEKDFTAGTAVAVYAVGQKDRLRATSVISQDDCGETRHVEGAFVSFVDTVLSMNVVGQSDPLRLVVSDRFGRPYMDSAQFIYTCSGEIVRASDIRAGERLSVVYLSIPRLGGF